MTTAKIGERIGELAGTIKLNMNQFLNKMGRYATGDFKFGETPPQTVRVIVCGEPYSGNRMTKTLIEQIGAAAIILHGIGDLPRRDKLGTQMYRNNVERLHWFKATHAVIPVRSIPYRELSALKQDPGGGIRNMDRDPPIWDVAFLITDWRLPTKMLSYEAVVEEPQAHARWLAQWLGLDPTIADRTSYDWVFDANDKYRK